MKLYAQCHLHTWTRKLRIKKKKTSSPLHLKTHTLHLYHHTSQSKQKDHPPTNLFINFHPPQLLLRTKHLAPCFLRKPYYSHLQAREAQINVRPATRGAKKLARGAACAYAYTCGQEEGNLNRSHVCKLLLNVSYTSPRSKHMYGGGEKGFCALDPNAAARCSSAGREPIFPASRASFFFRSPACYSFR